MKVIICYIAVYTSNKVGYSQELNYQTEIQDKSIPTLLPQEEKSNRIQFPNSDELLNNDRQSNPKSFNESVKEDLHKMRADNPISGFSANETNGKSIKSQSKDNQNIEGLLFGGLIVFFLFLTMIAFKRISKHK